MLFNSYSFIFLFLPLIFLLVFFSFATHKRTLTKLVFIAASLIFYGAWRWEYLGLIIASIIFNFAMGKLLVQRPSKVLLALSVSINLGALLYFKYANFFLDQLKFWGAELPFLNIILPLGISFFTFQQISFIVDCYRRDVEKIDFIDYFWFVSFFPHLIAGPILYHKEIIPQFNDPATFRFNKANISFGLTLFFIGLAKKVLLADLLAPWADVRFEHVESLGFWDAWQGMIAFSFQIYFDFSAYSDMAIGLAKMFNIDLPLNFNSPYQATSIIDFWRRWHMTLSRFLRVYLYYPLGGNRLGKIVQFKNIMIVMFLGGLWHGAAWKFIIWGGYHGFLLCANHLLRERIKFNIPISLKRISTFFLVGLGWVVFRASDLNAAGSIFKTMFDLSRMNEQGTFFDSDLLIWLVLFLIYIALRFLPEPYEYLMNRFRFNIWPALIVGLVAFCSIMFIERTSEFIYFQF